MPMHAQVGGWGRGRESQTASLLSKEPELGLNPMTLRSQSKLKPRVQMPNSQSYPDPKTWVSINVLRL